MAFCRECGNSNTHKLACTRRNRGQGNPAVTIRDCEGNRRLPPIPGKTVFTCIECGHHNIHTLRCSHRDGGAKVIVDVFDDLAVAQS